MNNSDNNYSQRYSFDKFEVNKKNQNAYTACLNILSSSWERKGLLFIYGKSGSGKTHLLISLYRQVKETQPDIKILYQPVYQFINEFIRAIRNRRTSIFLHEYYNLDILILDDFDELKGKEATQEEICHIISEFNIRGKKIVIAGLYHPRKYKHLDFKLFSRVKQGISIKIK